MLTRGSPAALDSAAATSDYRGVQDKMASRNPAVRALASATSHVWFPLAVALSRVFPPRALRALGAGVGGPYMRRRRKYVAALESNLARILGAPADSPEVTARVRTLIDGHFSAWADFLHFATRSPEESSRLVESVVGFERILEGRKRGKGVLLLTAHLGNWEVGGLMLAEVKQPIHVVLVPDIYPAVEKARRRLHERSGVTEIPIDRGADREAALARNLARYVAILERYVRQYPDQWYCFYPFWDDPSRRSG